MSTDEDIIYCYIIMENDIVLIFQALSRKFGSRLIHWGDSQILKLYFWVNVFRIISESDAVTYSVYNIMVKLSNTVLDLIKYRNFKKYTIIIYRGIVKYKYFAV